MFEVDDQELEAFELELRRFRPRAVTPLPFNAGLISNWTWRTAAAVAAVIVIALALWLPRALHQTHPGLDVVSGQPLTGIRARAALARGADVEDLAPLPIRQPKAGGVSALDVLSQE